MKTNPLTLLSMGRTLDGMKDRTGAYKLPNGTVFPKFGSAGRQRAATSSAARASVAPTQPNLFEKVEPSVSAQPGPLVESRSSTQPPPDQSIPSPHEVARGSGRGVPSLQPTRPHDNIAATAPTSPFAPKPADPKPAFNLKHFISAIVAKIPVPRWPRLRSPFPAPDPRPRQQTELALANVTVVRNDLSESDLVVVQAAQAKTEPVQTAPAAVDAAAPAKTPWTRAKARWINLNHDAQAAEPAHAQP